MNGLAVVTGGSRGIGRAILERFVAAGLDGAVCARNERDLIQMLESLRRTFPGRVLMSFPADLSRTVDCAGFTSFINALDRDVEVLVNNSGHFVPGKITEEPAGTLEGMIASNLYSAYYVTQGLVSRMKKRRKGHIFNMCSVASMRAYPNGGSYAIAKAGMLGFSRTLREELKEFGIRVTTVMPGATYTASWAEAGLPEERFMTAGDIAEVVYSAYSLSERSVVEEITVRPQLGDI